MEEIIHYLHENLYLMRRLQYIDCNVIRKYNDNLEYRGYMIKKILYLFNLIMQCKYLLCKYFIHAST